MKITDFQFTAQNKLHPLTHTIEIPIYKKSETSGVTKIRACLNRIRLVLKTDTTNSLQLLGRAEGAVTVNCIRGKANWCCATNEVIRTGQSYRGVK